LISKLVQDASAENVACVSYRIAIAIVDVAAPAD